MESSNPYKGFPQPSWAYRTFETRKECGQIRRSLHRCKLGAISSRRDDCLTGSFQEHQGRPMEEDGEPIWAVGAHKIEVTDLVLVRLDHVSKGCWQPQLQLLRPFYR